MDDPAFFEDDDEDDDDDNDDNNDEDSIDGDVFAAADEFAQLLEEDEDVSARSCAYKMTSCDVCCDVCVSS